MPVNLSPSLSLSSSTESTHIKRLMRLLLPVGIGLLLPFGFAPFHLPGLSILGVALFYLLLQRNTTSQTLWNGLAFGLGYFGFGISWIYISVHAYGHLHPLIAGFITLIFIGMISLFTMTLAWSYRKIAFFCATPLQRALCFSSLWVIIEYLRAHCFTGLPWLILGIGQIDSPLKSLLPIIGVYGTSFIACMVATCFAHAISPVLSTRFHWLFAGLALLLTPGLASNYTWTNVSPTSLSVGVIQANLSMRDKWDERLFWSILTYYKEHIQQLLGTDLIVLPESAIPLPDNYLNDALEELDQKAKMAHSAIILGIPAVTSHHHSITYYNSLLALGQSNGQYFKQHLVPFGEYIPLPFKGITQRLGIVDPEINSGSKNQPLVKVHQHAIASLICYEIAYEELLRKQLPEAEWIVSLSDDGWFGHSFAMHQHLQIAQVRSLQSGRYQVVSNNDGQSSVLNTHGEIVAALPAFVAGVLTSSLKPATGLTPWARFGDLPILIGLCFLLGFHGLGYFVRKS